MILRLGMRMLRETDFRLLWKFAATVGWGGMRGLRAHRKRLGRGEVFPPFLFFSVTDQCNLSCLGCWMSPASEPRSLDPDVLDELIGCCTERGSRFFGLLGGEPLLYEGLFPLMERHPGCYFQVFTNGTLLTDEFASEMRRLGNVTPLVSVEGIGEESDRRRGGSDIYGRALDALEACRRHRLITGVATSVCRTNFSQMVSESFVTDLVDRGVHYLWYYIYRPVGPRPSPELALDGEEILKLRRFLVEIRGRAPLMVVDAYWDQDGRALCPAASGISHHVGPGGDVEFCPPIQFAKENVGDGRHLASLVTGSDFLERFRRYAAGRTRGCILLEDPSGLRAFLESEEVRDTTGRGTGMEELGRMEPRPGHHLPGKEIPERHWFYRLMKKHWFFGFGAYG